MFTVFYFTHHQQNISSTIMLLRFLGVLRYLAFNIFGSCVCSGLKKGNGWSLMDLLMQFGLKTWTPSWMKTRSLGLIRFLKGVERLEEFFFGWSFKWSCFYLFVLSPHSLAHSLSLWVTFVKRFGFEGWILFFFPPQMLNQGSCVWTAERSSPCHPTCAPLWSLWMWTRLKCSDLWLLLVVSCFWFGEVESFHSMMISWGVLPYWIEWAMAFDFGSLVHHGIPKFLPVERLSRWSWKFLQVFLKGCRPSQ